MGTEFLSFYDSIIDLKCPKASPIQTGSIGSKSCLKQAWYIYSNIYLISNSNSISSKLGSNYFMNVKTSLFTLSLILSLISLDFYITSESSIPSLRVSLIIEKLSFSYYSS